ncbi:hypothetical protein P153DRAFT_67389 [Dothidotthia symphoricarpi CBS 119687]|uniref:Peptide N-acetyl-beta-D-glucosaminyl asparaginase amidase A N-terminal domain-containing protein n=1 Tax=Dothidotthia symphoricarpi CBS 119687 TaxID=1392245 RepID=A0A6A6A9T0_9PLEO|nr:uncharacterized protein P153DRAFT_67389 [Dothidotthia symphoricarpi CBS 119687]KAF2127431.1 hypothetical protein P153DRAFT_67389 [Dothidotthia symphoricarpi CBS 119687]
MAKAAPPLWPAASEGPLGFMFLVLMLVLVPHLALALFVSPPHLLDQVSTLDRYVLNESSSLECLQVTAPIFSPSESCQQILMTHVFAFSYGQPFIGAYYPPDCSFNRVTFKFAVMSAGRQFDRLALMFFGDIEIFRTSTAEPTQNGITWTYVKDMTMYLALFQRPQKIIFDLGNLVDDTYTGSWNTTLTAHFFTTDETIQPADNIIPVSARQSNANKSSGFSVPGSKAINTLTFPQNAKKAIFLISACGQAAEEFWWSNVFSSNTQAFGGEASLYGHSPFREVQLFIDGIMAGVAWPFPVIFTGGVVPGLWRPIVGIDAFDLREDEIDVSPFIPLLSDDREHTFEIRVVGIDDDEHGNGTLTEALESYWIVTGKLFIWLDTNTSLTMGTPPVVFAPDPSISMYSRLRKNASGIVQSLDYSVQVSRELIITSTIQTSSGSGIITWKQNLTSSSIGTLSNQGNTQIVWHSTVGMHSSPSSEYYKTFDYPLYVWSSYNMFSGGEYIIHADMDRGKYAYQFGELAYPNEWKTFDHAGQASTPFRGTTIHNRQNGTASYYGIPAQRRAYSSGSTEQSFLLKGVSEVTVREVGLPTLTKEELYRRHVIAANDSVVSDETTFVEESSQRYVKPWMQARGAHRFAMKGIKAWLGRGPF